MHDDATEAKDKRVFAGRWLLSGVTIVDGTGAAPYGPADILIDDGTIVDILDPHDVAAAAAGGIPTSTTGVETVDMHGAFVLPGLIDAHAHIGSNAHVEDPTYVYDLWLGHGISTVRELGSLGNGLDFTLGQKDAIDDGRVLGPSIEPYAAFGSGHVGRIGDPNEARRWVATAAESGATGVKFFGAPPDIFEAALDECRRLGLRSACHHSQQHAPRANALTTARWGLGSIEHSYGQVEAILRNRLLPEIPPGFNYNDEHARFAFTGRLWEQAENSGSAAWNDFLDELVDLGTTLVPTFAVYAAARDAERARTRPWHEAYTTARLDNYFTPSCERHGSFFFDWGTEEEVAWKNNFAIWMRFVRDFSLRGGRVCAGSDGGYIYNLYGFGLVEEMELLRESGMSALEVIRATTLHSAQLLGIDRTTGSVEVGKRADLTIVAENPVANLKVLYGHGHYRLDANDTMSRTSGVRYTVRNGVLYDSQRALARARAHVSATKTGRRSVARS
ncbi:amidohydrolase family protein [Rhodococcoides kroppenstedtii]|uniref:amidohydrolase family protein n=1 Tax=Rhodococcoides kroppenstedtii TaxID=293050 RepID=UPI00363ADF91